MTMVEIHDLQMELFDILRNIDFFCKQNGIAYSLFGGTLLGAVRHKGFIPWDDDLDICMTRDNYEKFILCWENSPVDGLSLQNRETDTEWGQPFSKIRRNHSTYIEYDSQRGKKNTGLFIDIFPIDRGRIGLISKYCDLLEWVIYFFCIKSITKEEKKHLWQEKAKKNYRRWFRKKLTERVKREDLPIAHMSGLAYIKRRFSPNLFDGYTELKFENAMFPVMNNWEIYLKEKYGDYMSLPPESERNWVHHPIVVSFDKSYDELSEEERLAHQD